MVVVQLARLGAEAQVGYRGERDGASFEAGGPYLGFLVLELYFQRLFLIVGEADFGGDGCGSKTSRLDKVKLVCGCVCALASFFFYFVGPKNSMAQE